MFSSRKSKFASVVLAVIVSPACTTPEGYKEALSDQLLMDVYENDRHPGVMAAVVQDGMLVWSGAIGHADLEQNVLLTPSTKMRIGSVSKTFTAVLALLESDLGRLDLDQDIRLFVPELYDVTENPITAGHLSAHTSGIRHYNFANYLEANNVYFYAGGPSEALGIFLDEPVNTAPGETFQYSSPGYNILGIALERMTDQTYSDLLRDQITIPLGLDDTVIDHPLEIVENRTRFYTLFPNGSIHNTIWRDSSDYYPSGGLLSSAEDLAKFANAVFQTEFLSEAAKAMLFQEMLTTDGDGVGYTFGWQLGKDDDGRRYYEHSGETNGAYATVRHYYVEKVTVAGIANMNFATGEPVFFRMIGSELPSIFLD